MSSSSTTYAPYDYNYDDEGAVAAGVIITIVSIVGFALCCCAPCIAVGIYCCVVRNRQQPVAQQQPQMQPGNNFAYQGTVVETNPQNNNNDIYNNDYAGGPQQYQQPQQGGGTGLYGGAYPTPPPPQEPNWAQPSNTNAGYNQPGPVTNGWVSSPYNGGDASSSGPFANGVGQQQQPMRPTAWSTNNTNDREAPTSTTTNPHPANFNPDYTMYPTK